MAISTHAAQDQITRDRITLTLYAIGGLLGFGIGLLSPVIKELRTDLHLSYTVAALHSTAYAVGFVASGIGGDQLVRRLGRPKTLSLSMTVFTVGVVLLCLGPNLAVTLLGALLVGTFGVFLQSVSTAVLSERHGAHRTTVVAELNAIIVLVGAISPVIVGGFVVSSLGWRGTVIIPLVLLIVMSALRSAPIVKASLANVQEPLHHDIGVSQRMALPGAFWWSWIVIVLAVASEFSALIWSVTYFQDQLGASGAVAAVLGGTFFFAEGIGRMVGGPFSDRIGSEIAMLLSIGVALVGFVLFWSVSTIPLAALGYFVTGLGIANLGIFPQALALSVVGVGHVHDRATTRLAAAIGLAMLIGPFALGRLADVIGIRDAYLVMPVLLFAAALVSIQAHRATERFLETVSSISPGGTNHASRLSRS